MLPPTHPPFNNNGLLADGTARRAEACGKAERAALLLPTSAPAWQGAPRDPQSLAASRSQTAPNEACLCQRARGLNRELL